MDKSRQFCDRNLGAIVFEHGVRGISFKAILPRVPHDLKDGERQIKRPTFGPVSKSNRSYDVFLLKGELMPSIAHTHNGACLGPDNKQ